MIDQIWHDFLFRPLFNGLILIYNSIAHQNLGWAVVWLTVILRLVLLPLSIKGEKDSLEQEKIEEEGLQMAQVYRNDPVLMKEEYRKFIKKHKISPFAKVIVLGIQILVLFLLYQVFINGINGERVIKILYPWIDYPGNINIIFYGFDIGKVHDSLWAGICAVYLFIAIFIEHGLKKKWETSEAVYLFLLPIATYFLLWWLPMVKSLFILTTMVFSSIIEFITWLFFRRKSAVKHS